MTDDVTFPELRAPLPYATERRSPPLLPALAFLGVLAAVAKSGIRLGFRLIPEDFLSLIGLNITGRFDSLSDWVQLLAVCADGVAFVGGCLALAGLVLMARRSAATGRAAANGLAALAAAAIAEVGANTGTLMRYVINAQQAGDVALQLTWFIAPPLTLALLWAALAVAVWPRRR